MDCCRGSLSQLSWGKRQGTLKWTGHQSVALSQTAVNTYDLFKIITYPKLHIFRLPEKGGERKGEHAEPVDCC